MDANTKFEIKAKAFQIMTGILAPGKDYPAAVNQPDYDLREESWKDWNLRHGKVVNAMILALSVLCFYASMQIM